MNYEKELHKLFHKDRISIHKEWFYASTEIVDWINNNTIMDLYIEVGNGLIKSYKKMKK